MLNISSPHVISWPNSPGAAVPPVAPITAVKPAQGNTNDAHADARRGGDERAARGRASHDPSATLPPEKPPHQMEAAPLLPYTPEGELAQPKSVATGDVAATEKGQDSEQVPQKRLRLQEVVASVWQASAAVVDRVLGRDAVGTPGPGAEMPGNQSDTAPDLSSVTATLVSRKASGQMARAGATAAPQLFRSDSGGQGETGRVEVAHPAVVELVHPHEVHSYDESGASNLVPLEAGTLVSERA